MFRMAKVIVLGILFSSAVVADDDDWDEYRGYGHHHHRHHYYPVYQEDIVYVPEPVVEYAPVQPRYYAPPLSVNDYGYDQRTTQGLIGGMLGSVMGYELGRGDPLAAGIGAAAGAWFGNGGW